MDDFRLQVPEGGHGEQADGDGQLEAARAAGAGIEVKHAFLGVVVGHVSVTVEDSGEFGGSGIEVEGLEVVKHIDVEAGVGRVLDQDDFGFRELGAGSFAIDVAADCCHRCELFQSFEDRRFADIADVEDAVDAAECWSDFGAEETMSVRDDAEEHGVRILGQAVLAESAELGPTPPKQSLHGAPSVHAEDDLRNPGSSTSRAQARPLCS